MQASSMLSNAINYNSENSACGKSGQGHFSVGVLRHMAVDLWGPAVQLEAPTTAAMLFPVLHLKEPTPEATVVPEAAESDPGVPEAALIATTVETALMEAPTALVY